MARDYGKVLPEFWTGETGRMLREAGRDCQLVAAYLITCPNANMIGLYHLPLPLLCHHLGLTKEGASKALQRVQATGFASFEGVTETIFVPQMARIQIGDTLGVKDNRHKWVMNELRKWRKSEFLKDFYRIYAEPFNLPDTIPFEAPSKPLRSQEQEQEQEQEKEQEQDLFAPQAAKRFVVPAVADVAAYCTERKNEVDAQAFVDFYQSKGWKVGDQPMKDWQAAVRTWERNNANGKPGNGKQPAHVGPGQRYRGD